MHKDRCLIICNFPNDDLAGNIEYLREINPKLSFIKESHSISNSRMLVTEVYSRNQVPEAVKLLNASNDHDLFAFTYSEYERISTSEMGPYKPLSQFSLRDLLSFHSRSDAESLVIENDGKMNLFCQSAASEIVQKFSVSSECSAISDNGIFLATFSQNRIKIFASREENEGCDHVLAVFSEIAIENVRELSFMDDVYLAIKHKDIFEFLSIYNIFTGKKIFAAKNTTNQLRFSKQHGLFFFEATNQVFSFKSFKTNAFPDQPLFLRFWMNLLVAEKLKPLGEIHGVEIKNIENYHAFGSTEAFITAGKVKTLHIYIKGELLRTRTLVNASRCRFFNGNNRLFLYLVKTVANREIFFIESFLGENITTNDVSNEITDFDFQDEYFVLFSLRRELLFFEFTDKRFINTCSIQKKHKVIYTLFKNMLCLYDYSADAIEFYNKHKKIKVYRHPGCDNIKWSKSGLFCVSYGSSVSTGGGMAQCYDCNGKLLFKRVFGKLRSINFRKYLDLQDIDEITYRSVLENMPAEMKKYENELSANDNTQTKENYAILEASWKVFIDNNRKRIQEYRRSVSNQI